MKSHIECINDKLQPVFEKEAREVIKRLLPGFKKKYPFVKSIECGMGVVVLSDEDGISMGQTNWRIINAAIASSDDHEDNVMGKIQDERNAAEKDELIEFLEEIIYSPIGFCPEEITL